MEKINFLGYIGGAVNISIGVVGGILTIGSVLKEHPLSTSALVVLITVCIVLVLSLFQILKDYQNLNTKHIKKEGEYESLNLKYENLEKKFATQSESYSENIKELNLHKNVTHVVNVVVSSTSPKSNDAKQIIEYLKTSIEMKLKGRD